MGLIPGDQELLKESPTEVVIKVPLLIMSQYCVQDIPSYGVEGRKLLVHTILELYGVYIF